MSDASDIDSGEVSDEEICSLLESSLREMAEEGGVSETTYVVRYVRTSVDLF